MKVTITIDCTPEEARHFFGLPDLKPMQDAVMAKVEQQMLDAVGAFSPDAMLRTWMGGMAGAPDTLRDMFTRFFRPPGGGVGGGGAPSSSAAPAPASAPPGTEL